jgi:autotransporter-associated beta strand protein
MVLLAGSLVRISASTGYFDALSSMDLVGQLWRSTGITAMKENESTGTQDAPLSTETWSGGDANDVEWMSNDNWAGLGGVGSDDDLVFPAGAARTSNHNNFGANFSFHSLTFTGNGYTVTGDQILLASGIVNNPGAGAGTAFSPNLLLGASQTFSCSSSSLTLNGVVNPNTHTLTIDTTSSAASIVMNALINGTGMINKTGPGKLTVNGDGNGFGTTNLNDGTLQVGSGGTLGALNLNGGTLTGTGTVGAISGNGAGEVATIAPGSGIFTTGILTSSGAVPLNSSKTLAIDLNGTTLGTQYDQLSVTGGDVALGNATLTGTLGAGFTPSIGQQFTIIQTSGAGNVITGQFAEGGILDIGGQIFTITYNTTSVVLTAEGSSRTWDGGGADNNWATAANWSSNRLPVAGLDLIFPAGAPADSLVSTNNIAGLDARTLTFGGKDYVIGGNAITLSDGINVDTTGSGTLGPILNANITLTGAQTFTCNGPVGAVFGGILTLPSFGLTVDGTNNLTFAGQVTGGGGITKNGGGTLFLVGTGNNYTGNTIINSGIVEIQSTNSLGATGVSSFTIVQNGATLQLGPNAVNVPEMISLNGSGVAGIGALFAASCNAICSIAGSVSLASNTTIGATVGQTVELSGPISSSSGLTKVGAGALWLNNSNSYTGVTNISQGRMLVTNSGALGATGDSNNTVVSSGGVLDINSVTLAEDLTLNAGSTLTTSGGVVTPTLNGAMTLVGTPDINVSSSSTMTINGAIGGSGGLRKYSTGTLVLAGNNSYTGDTRNEAGTLLVNGDSGASHTVTVEGGTLGGTGTVGSIVTPGASIAPGASAGILNAASVSFGSFGTFEIEIGGLTVGTQYDQLNVLSTTASLNGTQLTISFLNGFTPAIGDSFTILKTTGGNITGQFAQGSSIVVGGRPFKITYNATSIVLTAGPKITGTVTYSNAAVPPKFISNVTVTGTGSPNVSTTTAAPGGTAGKYSLSGFGAGSYTISPSKTTGQNGIGSADAARIAQHVAGTLLLTTSNQKVSADVSGNGGVSSQDAAKIAQFVAGLPPSPPNFSGTWRFFVSPGPTFPVGTSPTSRTYSAITNDIAGDDYIGLLIGDVTGNWAPGPLRPANGRETMTAVKAPNLVTSTDGKVIIPVTIQGSADKGIISYEFDLRYDPSVIQPQKDPVDLKGTVSRGLSAVANPNEPGLLRVVVYGPAPLTEDGLLLNLKFTAVGAPGAVSRLTWDRLVLNEGDPRTLATDGQVELSESKPGQAEIAGRVVDTIGQFVRNARVRCADTTGENRYAVSNELGVYRFGGLHLGQTCALSVESKALIFMPLTISVTDQQITVDLIAAQ